MGNNNDFDLDGLPIGLKIAGGIGIGVVAIVGGIFSALAASSAVEAGSRSSAMDAALNENNKSGW